MADYESGWDALYLPRLESATPSHASSTTHPVHPFMYHCHSAPHEDAGMMGQFVVVDNNSGMNMLTQGGR